MSDLDDLRKKAEAATPGPWEIIGGGEYVAGCDILVAPDDGGVTDDNAAHIAAHIAATDPSTALVLIDRCEAAEAAVARVRKVLEEWVAEYDDPVCRGNGFTDGVTAASKHAPSALDGEDA